MALIFPSSQLPIWWRRSAISWTIWGSKGSFRMPFRLDLLNEGGPQVPIHGGAIASLIDTAALTALLTEPNVQRTATISMSINYLTAGVASDLSAVARMRKRGRRIASMGVEVTDKSGQLVADSLVMFRVS